MTYVDLADGTGSRDIADIVAPATAQVTPVAEPGRRVAIPVLDPVAVGREVALALGAQVRVDVTRPDGTVRRTWLDPDGRTFAFDPAQTRTDPTTGGAVWVFDPVTSPYARSLLGSTR